MNLESEELVAGRNEGETIKPTLSGKFDRFDLGLVLFLLLSFGIVSQLPFAPDRFGDRVFFNEAKTIAEVIHGVQNWQEIIITRAPGPVLYYLIPFSLLPAGSSATSYWVAGVIWSMLWTLLAVLLIRRAAALIGGSTTGKLASILVVLCPFPVYYAFGILAETPAYFAAALACYGWARFFDRQTDIRGFLYLNLGLLLLILARPNAFIVLMIGIFAAGRLLLRSETRKMAVSTFAAIFLTGAFCLSGLLLPSWLSHGGQQASLGHVLFHGRFQYRTEPWDWRFWDKKHRVGSADYEMYRQEEMILEERAEHENVSPQQLEYDWARQDFLDNPHITLQQAAVRSLSLNIWTVGSKSPESLRIGFIPGVVVYGLIEVMANLAFFITFASSVLFIFLRRDLFFSFWVLWGVYLSLLMFHIVVYAEARYLFPSLPGLSIMGSIGLITILNKRNVPRQINGKVQY